VKEGYFKAREIAKEREKTWTLKQKLFYYTFSILIVVGLAFFPVFGVGCLILFILIMINIFYVFKKMI
jgi:hypothetical protein